MTIVVTTYDWVPEMARGYVREFRIRWLMEEISREYTVETVPLLERSADHIARQPFAQVPMIRDGDLSLFESGAILLYLAEDTPMMPPGDDHARTLQWVVAGLNSIEPFAMQWVEAKFFDKDEAAAAKYSVTLHKRLSQLQDGLGDREWLLGNQFTVADLLMSDILRIPAESGLLDDLHKLATYLERATARPAYGRAMADHMAHWQEADAKQTTAAQ